MTGPASRTVVLSPHLDDAIFSVGATISRATRRGGVVEVVTVFSGDPASKSQAAEWDRRAGFRSAGEAARARRAEDRAACRILGATPVWLPFREEQYGETATDDEIWEALSPRLTGAEAILVPGFPLEHADHRRLAGIMLIRAPTSMPLDLYAEQPYATWSGPPTAPTGSSENPLVWRPAPTDLVDRTRKWRACTAYRSQRTILLRRSPMLPWRVARYEHRAGGESLARVSSRNVHR